ncbi:MAG: glycyl-radical enzyme activating protein [Candidatus Humimicrobiaceae bacterium]
MIIFNIERMALHDGPGIRTTIFLKGCNMHCQWCHNPESISDKPELFFNSSLCIMCRKCMKACKHDVHVFSQENHILDRRECILCGSCVSVCPSQALDLCGKEMSVNEVMDIVMKDDIFYKSSEGGITISGGEPLCQPESVFELLRKAKNKGLHTVLETNGNYNWKKIKPMLILIDIIRFDLKHMDSREHKYFTGSDNNLILGNLKRLINNNCKVVISYPLILGVNDSMQNVKEMIKVIKDLHSVLCVDVIPYHNLYISKLEKLGKKQKHVFFKPSNLKVNEVKEFFREAGINIC